MTSNIVPKSSCFIPKVTSNTSGDVKKVQTQSVLNIPGTKTSLQNNQLLTPIGIPSIDFFIGGGLPVGSVILVGQDSHNSFSDIIARCFIAEGVSHKHSIYVADPSEDLNHLLQRIPNVNKTETDVDTKKEADELRIAWRYGQQQQAPKLNEPTSYQANYFVTNKFMSEQDLAESNIKSLEINEDDRLNAQESNMYLYSKLANTLTQHIDDLSLNIHKTKKYTNILRVLINSVGGLVWNDQSLFNEKHSPESLCKFLFYLRTLMRQSLAVCMITLPQEIVSNKYLFQQFAHLSDYVFSLDDTLKTRERLSKTQYNGLFRLNKLPSLNSLQQCFAPECLDLAFFVKRKRLVVEQLHLPPDLGENDDTQKGRTNTSVTMSCTSSGKSATGINKLDF